MATWRDLVKRFFPDVTEEECNFILWELTCYPFGSVLQVARQLKAESPKSQKGIRAMTEQELELIAIMEVVAASDLNYSHEDMAKALIEEGYVKARDNQDVRKGWEVKPEGADDDILLLGPEDGGFDAEFKPGNERSKEIAQGCAEAVMSASDEDLGDFKEYEGDEESN